MTDQAKTSAGASTPAGAAPATADRTAEVDEFAHIPTPRTRHPLVAAAAALLAFYLVFHIRHELRYALSPTAPLELGDATSTFAPGVHVSGIDNRYVRVRGTPDRESALELDTKGSWVFTQLFRVLGTGDRLFVHRTQNPLPAARAEDDVFEGRLIRFDDLSFQESIRLYFSRHVSATHFFPVDVLARALAAQPGAALSLHDRAGDAVTVAATDELAIDVNRPDEVRVALPRARFPDEASARAAVERNGGQVLSTMGLVTAEPPPGAPSTGLLSLAGGAPPMQRWTFVARFPAARRDAGLSALGELDREVIIRDARETLRARLADVRAIDRGATLLVKVSDGSERRVPVPTVSAARTVATVQIPGDAYLVIEADGPRGHLPTVLIGLVLAMFGVVNVAGLVRELRR
jgi:hypothetical protein